MNRGSVPRLAPYARVEIRVEKNVDVGAAFVSEFVDLELYHCMAGDRGDFLTTVIANLEKELDAMIDERRKAGPPPGALP